MARRVYLETTVISYLTATRPSRSLITAAHQQITIEWWEKRRQDFYLVVSELVLREAEGGDPELAGRRIVIDDPIVQEVRRIRQEHAAQFGYDLNAIFADLKKSENARGQRESPLIPVRRGEAAEPTAGPQRAKPRLARFWR